LEKNSQIKKKIFGKSLRDPKKDSPKGKGGLGGKSYGGDGNRGGGALLDDLNLGLNFGAGLVEAPKQVEVPKTGIQSLMEGIQVGDSGIQNEMEAKVGFDGELVTLGDVKNGSIAEDAAKEATVESTKAEKSDEAEEAKEPEAKCDPISEQVRLVLDRISKYTFVTEFPHTIKLNKNSPLKFDKIKQITELLNILTRDSI
jgi:hypothetical protein